jgi:hypothetical protein
MNHHRGAEDLSPTDVVVAFFDGASLDEVNGPTKEPPQFGLHLQQLVVARLGVGREGDQDVNVAARVEIVAEHRAKQGELHDPPLSAKVGDHPADVVGKPSTVRKNLG